ncbi:MAG: mechanosensitive ion channel family protein [Propionibacteriaceae bacterium]
MPAWFPATLAETVVFTPIRILFLLVVLGVARFVIHRLIDRFVRRSTVQPGESRFKLTERIIRVTPLGAKRREQRLQALGSLAKSVTTVVLLIILVVMVLAELGFNVTSLIAGTSLVGVTLAFGLQNVIKDLVSGVFMLVEDQLGIGDVVDMQQAGVAGGGSVEAVGLRVTQLRLDDGTVAYVRNGEITRILNYSQGGPGRLPAVDEPDDIPPSDGQPQL